MTTYKVEKSFDKESLAKRASEIIASHLDLVLSERDRAQIALSGGNTPADAYLLLAQEHLPWDRVDVFLGDERWVDLTNEASNAVMLRNTLLASGPGSKAKFHPVPTTELQSPLQSADSFASLIRKICVGVPPVFDLVLLGLGDDGHTASLFPRTESLKVTDEITTVSSGKGLERITVTAPVLNAARKVVFLVSGQSKQTALKRLLDESESSERTPARLVQPENEILVLADEAAAALI